MPPDIADTYLALETAGIFMPYLTCKCEGKLSYSAVPNYWYCMLAQLNTPLFWEAFSHVAIYAWLLFVHKYPPLTIARYSSMQVREPDRRTANEPAHVLTRQCMGSLLT